MRSGFPSPNPIGIPSFGYSAKTSGGWVPLYGLTPPFDLDETKPFLSKRDRPADHGRGGTRGASVEPRCGGSFHQNGTRCGRRPLPPDTDMILIPLLYVQGTFEPGLVLKEEGRFSKGRSQIGRPEHPAMGIPLCGLTPPSISRPLAEQNWQPLTVAGDPSSLKRASVSWIVPSNRGTRCGRPPLPHDTDISRAVRRGVRIAEISSGAEPVSNSRVRCSVATTQATTHPALVVKLGCVMLPRSGTSEE